MTSRKPTATPTTPPSRPGQPQSPPTGRWLPDHDEPAIRGAGAGQWVVDLSDGALRCSRQAAALFGYDQTAPPSRLAAILASFVADDRPFVARAFEQAAQRGGIEFEKRICRADDGSLRWLHISGCVVGSDGHPQHMAGLVTDVTAWRKEEEQLRHHERMEHFGHLCRKVAHDYNNLLMVIGANLEMLNERTTSGDEKAARYFAAAHHAVQRGATFNQQLLAFSGRLEFRPRNVDPLQLLKGAESVLHQEVGDSIVMRIEGPTAPPTLYVATDPDHLLTAVRNLVRNARDAMPDGGALVLSVSSQHVAGAGAAQNGPAPEDLVVISVTDTGTGIADTIIDRVFEPFFTTQEAGTVKGLGLSQVYGFVKQSGGFTTISRNVPTGTTVSIHLPRLA